MQRTYNEWRGTALALVGVLTDDQRLDVRMALLSGMPVTINDTLLKIDFNDAFSSTGNLQGQFVHAQNHLGFECGFATAASKTSCDEGLIEATRWAEDQLKNPDE